MRSKRLLFLATLISSAFAVGQAQECKARVLVPISDDLGNSWKPGAVLPLDIARSNAGAMSFCASGGSCLPGKKDGSNTLQLLNCKIGPALGGGDFRLIPSARLAGQAAASAIQRRQNATDKLSALGFSNASAGSLADDYVNRPQSRNAHLVAQALAGSQSAVASLKCNNP